MSTVRELVDVLGAAESMVIVCHDNPDPDCLASAVALRTIAEECDLHGSNIVHGGTISHQQTRALVNVLGVDLESAASFDPERHDVVAFVDHVGGGAYTDVTTNASVDIVIDYHPFADATAATFTDVREGYGSTSSILVEYLRDLDVEVPTELASALLFAMHRERLDNVRYPTAHEYELARHLYPLVDLSLVRDIYSASFMPSTIDTIGRAIENRDVRGSTLVSSVGRIDERSALAQAADFLLNLEGVATAFVYGVLDDDVLLSARSSDPAVDTAAVLRRAFGATGTTGGDSHRAGGQIPLGLFEDVADDRLVDLLSATVTDRFFGTMNLET